MKLIDKYIFKQVTLATIVGLFAFIVAWISPEILFNVIKQAIDGDISPAMAVKLFFLEIPEILGALIPASLMLGSIWVFDQFSKSSEITIMRNIGISFIRLTLPVIILSLFGVIISFAVHEYLIPQTTSNLKILRQRANKDHFVFVDKTKTGKPKEVIIVGGFKRNNANNEIIKDLILLKFADNIDEQTALIKSISTANTATFGKNNWILMDGTEYEIAPDGVYKNIRKFDSMKALSTESSKKAYDLLVYSTKKSQEMNLSTLKEYFELLKSVNLDTESNYTLNKIYQRFAQPLSCILFALCGTILGFSRPREKKFLGFTIGIALIFMYFITIPFIEMLSHLGVIHPILAAWIPNIIILISTIALFKYKLL